MELNNIFLTPKRDRYFEGDNERFKPSQNIEHACFDLPCKNLSANLRLVVKHGLGVWQSASVGAKGKMLRLLNGNFQLTSSIFSELLKRSL